MTVFHRYIDFFVNHLGNFSCNYKINSIIFGSSKKKLWEATFYHIKNHS